MRQQGIDVIPWDRSRTPIDDYYAMKAFLQSTQPDALFHLAIASQPTGVENEGWLVNYHWTGELAWLARQLGFKLVYTSTVMVWSDETQGPLTPQTPPIDDGAYESYGITKLRAEHRTREQNPQAIIARLGWQIGSTVGTNNMFDHITRTVEREGKIKASTEWLPSCSMLHDTAEALLTLTAKPAGTYLLNSNTQWSYYDIVRALNARHEAGWEVVPTEDFDFDQRMLDERVPMPPLEDSLPELKAL
jgi:dTDP-4-dehydrorhamnose reductase